MRESPSQGASLLTTAHSTGHSNLQKTGELQHLLLNLLCWQACWGRGWAVWTKGKLTAVRGGACLLQTPQNSPHLVPSFLFSSYFSMGSAEEEQSATAISYFISKIGSGFQALRETSFLTRRSWSASLQSAMVCCYSCPKCLQSIWLLNTQSTFQVLKQNVRLISH